MARLQLTAVGLVCVGAEVGGSIGPSEMLLPLLPSWPVGGASTTTDEQRQCYKYCDFEFTMHTQVGEEKFWLGPNIRSNHKIIHHYLEKRKYLKFYMVLKATFICMKCYYIHYALRGN